MLWATLRMCRPPWRRCEARVILQFEDCLRAELAFISLSPEIRSGDRINELHGDAQLRSRLAKRAIHHIARAKLLARNAESIDLFVAQSGAACDHS